MICPSRRAQFCRGWRAHFKIIALAVKEGRTSSEMAKNGGEGVTFDELHGAHRPLSGAETSAAWSSAVPLPQLLVRVEFWRRQGGQMAVGISRPMGRGERGVEINGKVAEW